MHELVKELIAKSFPEALIGEDENSSPKALIISADALHGICELIHTHEKCYFDQLACLTGIDNGEETGTMEVVYNLYSIPFNFGLMLKVELDRKSPVVGSVSDIWKTAEWHEREAFDLLGIQFNNHPDLRRILLPDDWEGFPLRKDYVEQEMYHEVKVKY